eukprot:1653828-Pleurochrysis_carterae.AAC.2
MLSPLIGRRSLRSVVAFATAYQQSSSSCTPASFRIVPKLLFFYRAHAWFCFSGATDRALLGQRRQRLDSNSPGKRRRFAHRPFACCVRVAQPSQGFALALECTAL